MATPIQGVATYVSWTDVCNGALRSIGAARISSLTDGSPSQLACSDSLLKAIAMVTSANDDWCVLRARAQLSVDSSYTPPNDYLYAYAVPSDCSDFKQEGVEAIDSPPATQPLPLPPGSPSTHPWSREQKWILTNATLVYLAYQRTLTNEDPASLPDGFLNAVQDALAVLICLPLRQNVGLLARREAAFAKSIAAAIANDDKMKETWEGSKTRGFEYYDEMRMTGGYDGQLPDPYRNY